MTEHNPKHASNEDTHSGIWGGEPTEHVCEREIDWDDGTAVCRLPDCKARPLRDWEINERLSATEKLSAELAREIGDCLYAGIIDHERKSAVLAYADTLEGK